MKHCLACCLLLAFSIVAPAADTTLKDARQRWLRGNYAEARGLYETLAKEAANKVPAAIGISRTYQSQGEYDKALDAIDKALTDAPQNADLLAHRAEILYFRGRLPEALEAAEKAVAQNDSQFLARWIRSRIYWDRADFKAAEAENRWFVRTYSERSNKGNEIKDADDLLLVGLAGAENARWHNLSDQFRFILRDVYGDALANDKDFWPAEYHAGLLLLEKYNRAEALDALDKALKLNPSAAEALAARAKAALFRFENREAEIFLERALKVNPHFPEALRLRSDLHQGVGDMKAAEADLEHARKINPRDENTLARLASVYMMTKRQKQADAIIEEVTKHNPKPGLFYYALAERMEDRKRYDLSEEYFKKSAEMRPMIPWALNGLGMLYMRMGREKEAAVVLAKAFKADEFNVRVSNLIRVLRHLEKYETLRTEHFEVRYDPQNDSRLAKYMADYLESIYKELADQFKYHPPGPILFEIFNNHEMFSGRTIALPDLHTIGASTGRIVAMVSPHGKGLARPFNWARVIRHELVHIFNLEQTNFQCPHWFTEGLAVIFEGYQRPQQWNQLLRQRVPAKDLLNLDTIDLAFIRPRSVMDWNMAYCQSQLYVLYIREKYGPQAVAELLAIFKDGTEVPEAIQKVCQVDKATFEKGYVAYLEEVVKKIQSKPTEKPMSYSQLQQVVEARPDDLDMAARLAEQHYLRQDKKEARKLVDQVLAKKSNHPMAAYVKSRLLGDAGDDDAAKKLLEGADRSVPEAKLTQALGKLYFEASEFDKAVDLYEQARKLEPYEARWLVELAKVYSRKGDTPKRIEVLMDLVQTDSDELEQRKTLMKLLLETKRFAEAERYARQALEIDIRDAEAKDTLVKALEAQKKTAEATKLQELLGK